MITTTNSPGSAAANARHDASQPGKVPARIAALDRDQVGRDEVADRQQQPPAAGRRGSARAIETLPPAASE